MDWILQYFVIFLKYAETTLKHDRPLLTTSRSLTAILFIRLYMSYVDVNHSTPALATSENEFTDISLTRVVATPKLSYLVQKRALRVIKLIKSWEGPSLAFL